MTESATKTDLQQWNEALVAYLHDELEADEREQVEQRISTDSAYRRQLQELQQAWDLLDALPKSDVQDAFAHSTVEMVAMTAQREVDQLRKNLRYWQAVAWGGAGLILLLAASLGYAIVATQSSRPNQQLLRDLPVIEHYDLLRKADSIQFLREMRDKELFAETLPESDSVAPPLRTDAQNEARLEALSATDKVELQKQKQRFERAPDEQRRRVVDFYQEFRRADDAAALYQVLLSYERWFEGLSSQDQAELMSTPADQRIGLIQRLTQQQKTSRLLKMVGTGGQTRLKQADARAIFGWLESYVITHEQEILAMFPAEMSRRLQNGGARTLIAGLRRLKTDDQPLPRPHPEEVDALIEQLSEPARRELLAASDSQDRSAMVQRWVAAAVESTHMVTREELRRFYLDELSDEQRGKVDGLEPGQRQFQIRVLYNQKKFGMRPPRLRDAVRQQRSTDGS